MESAVGWGYEGYETEARDGNGPREVELWVSWGERLTRISAEITDVKRVLVVIVVVEGVALARHKLER